MKSQQEYIHNHNFGVSIADRHNWIKDIHNWIKWRISIIELWISIIALWVNMFTRLWISIFSYGSSLWLPMIQLGISIKVLQIWISEIQSWISIIQSWISIIIGFIRTWVSISPSLSSCRRPGRRRHLTRPYCSQSPLILLRCVMEIKLAQNLRWLGNWH